MKLPAPIQTYFDADHVVDGSASPMAAFAADAVVKDEGKTYIGHSAIEAWWCAAKAQFQHSAAPKEFSQHGDRASVRAEVSGQFPGSPALLTFTFELKGDRIAALEITA